MLRIPGNISELTHPTRRRLLLMFGSAALNPKIGLGGGNILNPEKIQAITSSIQLPKYIVQSIIKTIATKKVGAQEYYNTLREALQSAGYPDLGDLDVTQNGKGKILRENLSTSLRESLSGKPEFLSSIERLREKGYDITGYFDEEGFSRIIDGFNAGKGIVRNGLGCIPKFKILTQGRELIVTADGIMISGTLGKSIQVGGNIEETLSLLERYSPEEVLSHIQRHGKDFMDKFIEEEFGKTKEQLRKEISDYEDKIFRILLYRSTALTPVGSLTLFPGEIPSKLEEITKYRFEGIDDEYIESEGLNIYEKFPFGFLIDSTKGNIETTLARDIYYYPKTNLLRI